MWPGGLLGEGVGAQSATGERIEQDRPQKYVDYQHDTRSCRAQGLKNAGNLQKNGARYFEIDEKVQTSHLVTVPACPEQAEYREEMNVQQRFYPGESQNIASDGEYRDINGWFLPHLF